MPRMARIVLQNYVIHVLIWGKSRGDVFLDPIIYKKGD